MPSFFGGASLRIDIPELKKTLTIPSQFFKTFKADHCCQSLRNNNGSLAEMKACQIYSFLRRHKIFIEDFVHSCKNGHADRSGIDIQLTLRCGHVLMRQLTSSEDRKKEKLKRIREGKTANVPVDIVPPEFSLADTLTKVVLPPLRRHFRRCSRP